MPATVDLFTNFGVSSIAGGASGRGSPLQATDTTLYLPTGDGAKFPQPANGATFRAQIGASEIAIVTGRSIDTLTLTRGAEGTTATTALVGTSVQLAVTAASFSDLWAAINRGRWFNPLDWGAQCNGVADDTGEIQVAINAAGSAGGGIVLLPGLCGFSAPLSMSSPGVWLWAAGWNAGLKALAGFSGSYFINVTADLCGAHNLKILGGPNTTSAANPAVTAGIEVAAARTFAARLLQLLYINGWALENAASASVNDAGSVMETIHVNHCAQGIHLLGNAGSNNVGQHFLSNYHPEAIDNGDALLLEDINDIEVVNMNGMAAGGARLLNHDPRQRRVRFLLLYEYRSGYGVAGDGQSDDPRGG